MRRRRHEEEHDAADRWLISYADLITLLFAFFVVMYSVSLQKGRYEEMTQSVREAMGHPPEAKPAPEAVPPVPDEPAAAEKPPENPTEQPPAPDPAMQAIVEKLAQKLSGMLKQGEARLRHTTQGVYIEIDAGIMFDPAEAYLSNTAREALRAVAEVLKDQDSQIHVLGHTDNQDIKSGKYPSNWELSAARASSVVRLFAETGIDPTRLVAMGHGSTKPIADNNTRDGRLRNRRVEIQILTQDVLPKKV